MANYQQQRVSGTTIFRAKSVKEAMAEARVAFGVDASIVSVEKVGKLYCVEITPPAGLTAKPENVLGLPAPVQDNRKYAFDAPRGLEVKRARPLEQDIAKSHGFDLAALASVERLEKRFEELSSRIDITRHTQAEGVVGMASIRSGLNACGFSEPFLGKLAGAMIDAGAVSFNKELPMRIIASWLEQLGVASDFEQGWHALVGPAGSGKTTSIAKFASRAVAKWGSSSVGLVTTDFFRIGAYEQLRLFGELLGVKVYPVRSFQELKSVRDSLADKKVVFVDTVGSSRDDDKMREQMGMFAQVGIESTMALQACLARSVMRLDLGRWRDAGATSALITKMDQATGVASLVEALIMRGLPVGFASTGQRVPVDLHKVSALLLAHKAMRGESVLVT
jgi:flagellar biosynthesis GTPase FlhF